MSEPTSLDGKLLAGVRMIERTGATHVQLRFSDETTPVVWFAVALYPEDRWETAAAGDPVRAITRLCELLVDGGQCTHCGRPAGLDPDTLDTMPLDTLVCWYQYDPELETFRRGCEGDT